jgi:hypothetical protein
MSDLVDVRDGVQRHRRAFMAFSPFMAYSCRKATMGSTRIARRAGT